VLDSKGNFTDELVPLRCLDVAGGTGDISFKILEKSKRDNPHSTSLNVDITVSDINPDMLEVGKKRAIEQGIFHDLKFKVLNAEQLQDIESDSMDLYTVAFGIRNVTNRD
jgi:2-methoxy-6-polyprenyl-1,4-benzoquinol methylase